MEEQFQLHEYGKLSTFEQAQMTAEERAWWLKRVEKEFEERKKAEENAAGSVSRPSMPNIPSAPSINVPSINVPRMGGR
jgi:hypothetical protein